MGFLFQPRWKEKHKNSIRKLRFFRWANAIVSWESFYSKRLKAVKTKTHRSYCNKFFDFLSCDGKCSFVKNVSIDFPFLWYWKMWKITELNKIRLNVLDVPEFIKKGFVHKIRYVRVEMAGVWDFVTICSCKTVQIPSQEGGFENSDFCVTYFMDKA